MSNFYRFYQPIYFVGDTPYYSEAQGIAPAIIVEAEDEESAFKKMIAINVTSFATWAQKVGSVPDPDEDFIIDHNDPQWFSRLKDGEIIRSGSTNTIMQADGDSQMPCSRSRVLSRPVKV